MSSTVQHTGTGWITKLMLFLLRYHPIEILAVDTEVHLAVAELESRLYGGNTGAGVPKVVIDQTFLSVEPGPQSPDNVQGLYVAVSLTLGLGLQFSSLLLLFELLGFHVTQL